MVEGGGLGKISPFQAASCRPYSVPFLVLKQFDFIISLKLLVNNF